MIASQKQELSSNEESSIQRFIKQTDLGLKEALSHLGPVLIIAHGGTYWAISHILNLEGDWKIDNCKIIKITKSSNGKWKNNFIF